MTDCGSSNQYKFGVNGKRDEEKHHHHSRIIHRLTGGMKKKTRSSSSIGCSDKVIYYWSSRINQAKLLLGEGSPRCSNTKSLISSDCSQNLLWLETY